MPHTEPCELNLFAQIGKLQTDNANCFGNYLEEDSKHMTSLFFVCSRRRNTCSPAVFQRRSVQTGSESAFTRQFVQKERERRRPKGTPKTEGNAIILLLHKCFVDQTQLSQIHLQDHQSSSSEDHECLHKFSSLSCRCFISVWDKLVTATGKQKNAFCSTTPT